MPGAYSRARKRRIDVGVEGADRLGRAEDRAADGLGREGRLHEGVVDEVVGRILDGGDLLEDDALLAGEFGGFEDRVRQDVADHVESDVDRFAQDLRGIARILDARRGIDVAADILDILRDPARGPAGRALEGHVFEKVRRPCSDVSSCREPVPTHTPRVAVAISGMRSVATVKPFASVVISMTGACTK